MPSGPARLRRRLTGSWASARRSSGRWQMRSRSSPGWPTATLGGTGSTSAGTWNTGLRPDQCLGLAWQLALHPDHRARVLEGQQVAFKAGREWEDTVPVRGADGEYRWFLTRAKWIKDGDGRIVRWIGTNTDVTEHLESERALAASEERFRRALAIETVGVILFDRPRRDHRCERRLPAHVGLHAARPGSRTGRWTSCPHRSSSNRHDVLSRS